MPLIYTFIPNGKNFTNHRSDASVEETVNQVVVIVDSRLVHLTCSTGKYSRPRNRKAVMGNLKDAKDITCLKQSKNAEGEWISYRQTHLIGQYTHAKTSNVICFVVSVTKLEREYRLTIY
jgi:hypothetical protein